MYKLLVLDIDDTLTTAASREIPARNLAAIHRAQQAGIHITVATGRGYLGASYIWRRLGLQGPVINYGGALVMDTRTDQPIHTAEVQPELVTEVLELAAASKLHVHLYQGDTVVYEKESAYGEAYANKLGLPYLVDPDIRRKVWHNVPKVLIVTEDDRAKRMIPALQKQYAGRLKVSGSSPGFIEFNNPTAHKGSAAAFVAEHLGFTQAQTVAVGDNSLDLEMIRWAGLGCAVGNAEPEIRAVADLVLPACEDMAVEYLIDNVLLKG
ncbi:MAG: Cof-type HAD-IIB family hydrolase [Candidatus Pelethousia sp.]|nr:Cof-type HAD-IIB family hydrolase [Candidatus Pelethousia sp.]